MHFNVRQLKLLLWKDYLVRKRKPITLGGIVWAAATIISLVIVRSNVNVDNNPTCQFKARALPSAGLVPFLQSLICTVNNQCEPLDKYEEIPSYSNAKLQHIQRQLRPVFQNETILDTVEQLPNSIKLLATVTKLMDDPEIHNIVRYGLNVSDLFTYVKSAKNVLSDQLKIPETKLDTLLQSSIQIENVIEKVSSKKSISCNRESISGILSSVNPSDIGDVADKLCNLESKEIKELIIKLVHEINLKKYLILIGNVLNKLDGSETISNLGAMLNSVLRLTDLWNYVPNELQMIKNIFIRSSNSRSTRDVNKFSYFSKDLLYRFVTVFENLFNETDTYKTLLKIIDVTSDGMESIKNILDTKIPQVNDDDESFGGAINNFFSEFKSNDTFGHHLFALSKRSELLETTVRRFLKERSKLTDDNAVNILANTAELFFKFLEKDSQFEIMYYLTLLDKMINSLYGTLRSNFHMEEVLYNVSARHPGGLKKIVLLGPSFISKVIDGLTDTERVQALTRKIYHPDKMFCDTKRLQLFLKMTKDDVNKIKPILCDPVWHRYIADAIESFGVYNISKNINKMSSLVFAKTVGKDVKSDLITLPTFFNDLYVLIKYLINEAVHPKADKTINWETLFNDTGYEAILTTTKSKSNLTNIALVTVHTALAREVLSNSSILETFISPNLVQVLTVMKALSQQLDKIPLNLLQDIRENIISLTEIILATLGDQKKTINTLTTNSKDLFCDMVKDCENNPKDCNERLDNNKYVIFPPNKNALLLTRLMCDISTAFYKKLDSKFESDAFLKTIHLVLNNTNFGKDTRVNWNDIISTMQKVYLKMDKHFGFVFQMDGKSDDDSWKNVQILAKNLTQKKTFLNRADKAIELSIPLFFHTLQIMDSKIFDLEKSDFWITLKNKMDSFNSILYVSEKTLQLIKVLINKNEIFDIPELPLTSKYLLDFANNLPYLLQDIAIFITSKEVDVQPFLDILYAEKSWPCSNTSIAMVIKLNNSSSIAMKSLEALLCVNDDLQMEWDKFDHLEKLPALITNTPVSLPYAENLFLETSSNFIKFTDNLFQLQNIALALNDKNNNTIEILTESWKETIDVIKKQNFSSSIIRRTLKNIDALINSSEDNLQEWYETDAPARLWENSMECMKNINMSKEICKEKYWVAVKYTVKYLAEAGHQMSLDLNEYFSELLEPGANTLQLIGFIKRTGPYIIYSKLPDFIEVLLNSFLDQGFMQRIHQSIGKQFWDCERILDNMIIPSTSRVVKSDISAIKPYICPSLLHWVSVPVNENVLLDLFSKSQFIFFNKPVSNFSATFENLYDNSLILNDKMLKVSKSNTSYPFMTDKWIDKFSNIGQTLITNNTGTHALVSNILETFYLKNIINTVFLTEVTNVLNYISTKTKELNQIDGEFKKDINETDLRLFTKLLEKRPKEVIETVVFAVVEELKIIRNYKDFSLIDSLDRICKNESYLTNENMWIKTNLRMAKQFCKTDYKKYINIIYKNATDEFEPDNVISNFIEAMINMGNLINFTDTNANFIQIDSWKKIMYDSFELNSTNPGDLIKLSTQYARNLGMNTFLHYMDTRVKHFNLVLNFVSGHEWWEELRGLYNGTKIKIIFEIVENSPFIIDDIVSHIPNIKIIRLLKDMKLNDTKTLCKLNLSDYIPDKSGRLSGLKDSLCTLNVTDLYKEIMPLRLAAQIYDENFKITKEADKFLINDEIEKLENNIQIFLQNGPKKPLLPHWLTNDDILKIKNISSIIKTDKFNVDISFFLINSIIDAVTLFNNQTYSPVSSAITPWIKQINLQLIKKEEYTTFLCDLQDMTETEIHKTLVDTFHWNLALTEIMSGRNYTWIEMNKSLNELLDLIRSNVYDSVNGKLQKLSLCLINSTEVRPTDKMAFYLALGSNIMKLIRASVPHFKEVDSFTKSPKIKHLFMIMNQTLPLLTSVENILVNKTLYKKEIERFFDDSSDVEDFLKLDVDLNKIVKNEYSLMKSVLHNPDDIKLVDHNIANVLNISMKYLNSKYIKDNIEELRLKAFWSFEWLSKIIIAVEKIFLHSSKLVQSLGSLDWNGLNNNQINSTIDFVLQLTKNKYVNGLSHNLESIVAEFHPILKDFTIEKDLFSVVSGLKALGNLPNEFIESSNVQFELRHAFRDWEYIKTNIHENANISMKSLDAVPETTIDLMPLLDSDVENIHIREYICNPHLLSKIIKNNDQQTFKDHDKLNVEDFSKELCDMSNEKAQETAVILLQKLNFTTVFDFMYDFIIKEIMLTSKVSQNEGNKVIENFGKTASLMPVFREFIANISQIMKDEPLIKSFQGTSSVTNLLSNSEFMENAGKMLCGKPFVTRISRFYTAFVEKKDNIIKPDQRQLDSLPTDYCRDLYKEVLHMGGGKILWTFAKPIMMGKILYTPDNPEIRDVISNANDSFAQIGRLTGLLAGFANGFSSLDDIVAHKESLFTMQKLLQSTSIQMMISQNYNGDSLKGIDLTQLINEIGNSKKMQKLISKVSNITRCISLDRFVPVKNENELQIKAANLMQVNEFMAGVVFLDADQKNNSIKNLKYKIRMDIDNVPSTSHIKNKFWMPGPNANFIENLRYFRGFIQLQDIIDKAIITSIKQESHKITKRATQNDISIINNNLSAFEWGTYTQQMPYPCYIQDDFQTTLYESQALVAAFFFSLILVLASVVRNLVWERESGNTTLMRVMGMKYRYHIFSWFISSLLEVFATMIVLCIILKLGNILPKTDTFILMILLFNFGISVVMFCYMVTSLFKSASLAAVSAVIFYLIVFLPFIIIISLESILSLPEKLLTSLFMSSGFCYTMLLTVRYEVQGVGLQWDNFYTSPMEDDAITAANTSIVIVFDIILYAFIGWLINKIRFNEKIHLDDIKNDSSLQGSSVGVRVEKLTKIYRNGKKERKALDNVTIDLIKGHITTLLGHNGAGKTTLIKILMGIVKPDEGKISIAKSLNEVKPNDTKRGMKNHIGLCPQSDVLIESMSSKEHLMYYAQLKTGETSDAMQYDVECMIETMGLKELCLEPVHRLSGGLRRRLTVGLAFIANPHLVVLDEPSSGVDPVARRDIWSLIVGLKQNRTILLTTHHLDEAELLSDTIVIMHKGKVQTCGSPLELKHKYGNGYTLNVIYPSTVITKNGLGGLKNSCIQSGNEKELIIDNVIKVNDEKEDFNLNIDKIEMISTSKDLLNIVKEKISNCSANNVSNSSITINLPFLDNTGKQNDFAGLVQHLEKMKPSLKYLSLSLDCSSLEQVFLSICRLADGAAAAVEDKNSNKRDPESGERQSTSNSCSSIESQSNSDEDFKYEYERSNPALISENEDALCGSFGQHMKALLKKRFLHYSRNYRLLIITLVLPALFVALAMAFSLIRPPPDSEDPIMLSPNLYNKFSAEFISIPNSDFDPFGKSVLTSLMKNSMKDSNRSVEYWDKIIRDCQCDEGFQKCIDQPNPSAISVLPQNQIFKLPTVRDMIHWIVNTEDLFIEKRYGGWSSTHSSALNKEIFTDNQTKFSVWYHNNGEHAMPSYLNALNNMILQKVTNNANANITAYNHPLKLSKEQLSKSTILQHVADVGIAVVLLVGFSLIPPAGSIYLIKERTSQEKRLQLLCGVSPFTYWLSALIWDVLIIAVAVVLSCCVFEIYALPIYVTRENLPAICLLLLLYGFSCSSLTHIVEKLFDDASLGNMIMFCVNVFTGATGLAILLIMDVLMKTDYEADVRWMLHKIFLIFPQFALGDGLVEISKNTIQASVLSRFGMDTYTSPLGWDLIGPHYVTLTLTTIVFFLINLVYEYHLLDNLFIMFQKKTSSSLDADMEDCDVATERYRVELSALKAHYNMSMNVDPDEQMPVENPNKPIAKCNTPDVLQTLSLRKIYKGVIDDRVAVDNLTFGLKAGQCFGLLGVNGAGKSTTFKMLTGELIPSDGQIFVNGKRVTQRSLCNGSISYCPQVDALDDLLTLTEHLELYCRLRGLTDEKKRIQQVLRQFDLSKYKHQKSKTLSGGNKRKLCTAISLMGNSSIVLLDEPTSGMDPGARQYVAVAVKEAIRSGRCLLLSSHSLIECESLCQIAAVTSLGRFLALGPPSYLKHKYGGGCLISVRLASPNQKGQLVQSICEAFPHTQVQNSHYCTTQFLIPIARHNSISNDDENNFVNKLKLKTVKTRLSDIFVGLNTISNTLDVIDYSVNQSSLDQVFINFAHNQANNSTNSKESNGEIKLSTLERTYNKKQTVVVDNDPTVIITKF